MDTTAAYERRRELPGEGHRLSSGDGRARPLRSTLPGVRRARAAHRACRERNQLLCALPDRWQDPRRSRAIPPAAQELAAESGRARVASWLLRPLHDLEAPDLEVV